MSPLKSMKKRRKIESEMIERSNSKIKEMAKTKKLKNNQKDINGRMKRNYRSRKLETIRRQGRCQEKKEEYIDVEETDALQEADRRNIINGRNGKEEKGMKLMNEGL